MKKSLFRNVSLINIFILLTVSYSITFAQVHQLKKYVGKWISDDMVTANNTKVSFKAQNQPLRFILVIEDNDGKLTSVLDSPDAKVKTISDETKISGDSVTITFSKINGIFRGELNSDQDQLSGRLALVGKVMSLGFKKELETEEIKQITSQWTVESSNEEDSLLFVLKTYKTISGAFKASLDLPKKNLKNILVTNFIVKNDSLNFEVDGIDGKFGGRIIRESNSIKGLWKQNNKDYSVEFKKD